MKIREYFDLSGKARVKAQFELRRFTTMSVVATIYFSN